MTISMPSRRTTAVLALVLVAGILGAIVQSRRSAAHAALHRANAWDYQLQNIDVGKLARSTAELAVVDYSKDGSHAKALTRAEVEQLKRRPDGTRRLAIAYLSIGEAEEYRYYWQPAWKTSPPAWLYAENCRWPGNHLVRYWMEPWQDIMFRARDSYLQRIIAAGFDGVYLDRIDAYWDLRDKYPGGRAEMLTFMRAFAETARRLKPDIIIIAQNAEDLLSEPGYRASIDAIAKEDLLFGTKGTAVRNEPDLVAWSIKQMRLLQAEQKPVFVVEYLDNAGAITSTRAELDKLGFRATFPPRALDGSDPLAKPPPVVAAPSTPAPSEQPSAPVAVGTPEYGVKHCK